MRASLSTALLILVLVSSVTHAELRLGIEPRGSAAETQQAFAPLAEYLTRELQEPIRLIISDDFTDYDKRLQNREFDVAFAAPATILYSVDVTGAELTAVALDRDSGATLKGVFLVPKDAQIESLAQLKGKRIAYVAKSSQGYIVQSHTLRLAGIDPEKDIQAQFTQKLDRAVAAVIEGKADAAGVGDVVFSKLKGKMDLTSLRVLSTSPATPNWVMVSLRPDKSPRIMHALLKLEAGSPLAASALAPSNFVGFQKIDLDQLDYLKAAVRPIRGLGR